MRNKKNLRTGYTTGACAAAAAKAVTTLLLQSTEHRAQTTDKKSLASGLCLLSFEVEIPLKNDKKGSLRSS